MVGIVQQKAVYYAALFFVMLAVGLLYVDANIKLSFVRPLIAASIALSLITLFGAITIFSGIEIGQAKIYPGVLFFIVLFLSAIYLFFPAESQSVLSYYFNVYLVAGAILVLTTIDQLLFSRQNIIPASIYTTKAPYAIPPQGLLPLFGGVALLTFGLITTLQRPLLGYPTFGTEFLPSLVSGLIGEAENITFIFGPFWLSRKFYTAAGVPQMEANLVAGLTALALFIVMHSRVYGGNFPALMLVAAFATVALLTYALTGNIFIAGIVHFVNNLTASLYSYKTFAVFSSTPINGAALASFGDIGIPLAIIGVSLIVKYIIKSESVK